MSAYGFSGGLRAKQRILASPLAHEGSIIARVQSMRTRGGHVAEPLGFAESERYLRNVERAKHRALSKHRICVTVPAPLADTAGARRPPAAHHETARTPSSSEACTLNAGLRGDSAHPLTATAARAGSNLEETK